MPRFKVLDDSKGFNPNRIDLQKPLVILMSMAGLLVVLCAINVATLLLLRAANRAREMSMRYALGARRGRIISQLMIEGGVLGLTGASCRSPAGASGRNCMLVRILTNSDPGTEPYSASVDMRVLLFTLGISRAGNAVIQHCAGLPLPPPESRRNALRQNAGTLSRIRSASASSPWARRLRSASCYSAAPASSCARSTIFVTSRLGISKPQTSLHFRSIPATLDMAKIAPPQIVTSSIEALRRIPGVVSVAAQQRSGTRG